MATMKKRSMVLGVLGAIATLGITSPVLAANRITLTIGTFETPVSIAALESFAQTGNISGLPPAFSFLPSQLREKFRKQLNRPVSIDPDSELDPLEEVLLSFLLPNSTEAERKSALTLMAQKANGEKTINFMKALPGDTITPNNFLQSVNAYQPTPITNPFDLRTWKQEGSPANGRWIVSPDGTFVDQKINGRPTFFVSPDNFINTTINGKFKVTGKDDNDFIGFVFGYQSPISANGDKANDFNFLLFDWKKTQYHNGVPDRGNEGFGLAKVNGNFPTDDDEKASFWRHEESQEFDLLATDYGRGKGWRTNQEYDFTLLYQTDRIKIDIDGKTIFDVRGEFPEGRFGFYNYSQSNVRYSGFTKADIDPQPPKSVPEPASVFSLLAFGAFGVSFLLKRKQQQKALDSVATD
jgi:Thrombospondin C-terminal region/Alpha/beta hydrolase of unknown function (DUF1400)